MKQNRRILVLAAVLVAVLLPLAGCHAADGTADNPALEAAPTTVVTAADGTPQTTQLANGETAYVTETVPTVIVTDSNGVKQTTVRADGQTVYETVEGTMAAETTTTAADTDMTTATKGTVNEIVLPEIHF